MRLCDSLAAAVCLVATIGTTLADDEAAAPAGTQSPESYSELERSHWSLEKVLRPELPQFDDDADRRWIRQPIDAFILQKLKETGLRPAGEADRLTLIRRLSFDLTGLPPTPDEIAAFVEDRSPQADEHLIERLLSSPHYGERWGQHWLDVVRFAESEGFEYDAHHPNAWRYRDYVIRAFNDDKPYDRFLREQLAGDELVENEPETADGSRTMEAQIAVGLHRLGPVRRNAGNADVAFSRNEVLTEMTNIVGSGLLGLTVGCARCHDHFFDPFRQKDYYRLQAFLAATHEHDIPLSTPEERRRWQARQDEAQAEIDRIRQLMKMATGEAEAKLEQELEAAEGRLPPPLPAVFSVRNDDERRTPIHLLERGEEDRPRELLGMRFPGVLLPEGTPEFPADTSRPRTLLANWVSAADNPLTARVMVNRIWQWHFGTGIVPTSNDFGVNGTPPSHPELLDFLADEFVQSGWSVKSLHRMILLSSTYRQASHSPLVEGASKRDPENRLLWRFHRRRLDAEEIRDAMLAVSGRLNREAGGPSVIVPVEQPLIDLLYKPSQWAVTPETEQHRRRSVYLLAKRNLKLPFMEVFDQPDLQISCARRERSTHAPQALELLNGKLSNALAEAFARRLQDEAGSDPAEQVELAFQLATGRPPGESQKTLALAFLKAQPLRELALAMFNLNSFLYVD